MLACLPEFIKLFFLFDLTDEALVLNCDDMHCLKEELFLQAISLF